MRLLSEDDLYQMRERAPVKYEINPVPFLLMGGAALWVAIEFVVWLAVR